MSTGKKTTLGVLAFFPIVSMVAYFVFFTYILSAAFTATGVAPNSTADADIQKVFMTIGSLVFVIVMIQMITIVTYIILVIRNNQLESASKLLWGFLVLFFNLITAPIYWYLYIWKQPAVK